MLKINITNLQDGEYIYDFFLSQFEIDVDSVEIVEGIFVKAKLYKSGNQFSVNVNIKGKFKLQCDRCLDEYIYGFDNIFDVIYKFDYSGKEIEESDDDIKFISPNTKFIDLKDDVRDYILLSVPMRKVPEEKDGICLYCKNDTTEFLNIIRKEEINPVWEKLIKVKSK